MPARLIRDGILESEAVLSLPVEGRWLYVSVLLSADDLGLFEATPFRLARRADVRRELADTLLQMLVDQDLVRLYEVAGKRYGFIPRYGQRVQIKRARCPLPPLALLEGDEDALNKIKHLTSNPTVDFGGSPGSTAIQQPEPEPEPEPEVTLPLPTVEGRGEPEPPKPRAKPAKPVVELPDWLDPELWAGFEASRKAMKKPLTDAARKLAIGQLDRLRERGYEVRAIVEQTVLAGWQSFYEPKPGRGPAASRAGWHSGFQGKNYRDGVGDDGRLL